MAEVNVALAGTGPVRPCRSFVFRRAGIPNDDGDAVAVKHRFHRLPAPRCMAPAVVQTFLNRPVQADAQRLSHGFGQLAYAVFNLASRQAVMALYCQAQSLL